MSINVTMPKLGMTMKTGKLSKWYKNEGDPVEEGGDLFEVETDALRSGPGRRKGSRKFCSPDCCLTEKKGAFAENAPCDLSGSCFSHRLNSLY